MYNKAFFKYKENINYLMNYIGKADDNLKKYGWIFSFSSCI